LGTADYMSPEQADGRAITEKCDQYSLGCVMYALLAGRPPFKAKSMPEMLQLQRFAQPEPVRRYAPHTPEELDRLIRQLLSKEPHERFPNVLVLGRHMEAMHKALSRPARPEPEPEPKAGRADKTPLDSTAVFQADATLSPEDLAITPSETTDSGVYNAPTLADEGQLQAESPPARASSAATATQPAAVKPRESRFTTVEEARRRAAEQSTQRWELALQLAMLLATIAGIGWLGWWLTRPASADDVYAAIEAGSEEDLGDVESEINEFLARFPNDRRAEEVEELAEELALEKQQRRIRRGLLPGGEEAHPITTVFAEAIRLREQDPARAARMIEDLLALYPVAGGARESLSESQRTNLRLAERELESLRERAAQYAAEQLPELRQRLQAARRLELAQPEQAAAMYQALVDLYDGEAWAATVVDTARERLQVLAER
ncbi:MAG TPA: hypothetical protein VF175_17450, partial [Lacipirellula sp.]